MRQNYFGKLIKYIKNVYKIDDELRSLTDGRINPTYQTGHVASLALFGFLLIMNRPSPRIVIGGFSPKNIRLK